VDQHNYDPLYPSVYDVPESSGCLQSKGAVQVREGEPICDVDELVQNIVTRSINRYDAADKADEELDLIMLKRRGIDFRLGELLTLFKKKKGEDYMGHRSIGMFSVEHLSFSGRLASELMRNSGLLEALPSTKEAYLQGEIKKSALRHLSRVLTPENEAKWIAKTKKLSLKALERMVKKALQEKEMAEKNGSERSGPADADRSDSGGRDGPAGSDGYGCGEHGSPGGADGYGCGEHGSQTGADISDSGGRKGTAGADSYDTVESHDDDIPSEESTEPQKGLMMYLDVSIRLAPVWDFALEQFRNGEQVNGSTSTFVEALLANYITSGKRPGNRSSAPAEDSDLPVFYSCHMKKPERDEELFDDDDDRQIPAGKSLAGTPEDEAGETKQIVFPPSFHETPETVEDLADKLIELARYRQELDVGMAKILWAIEYWDLYSVLGYSQIEEYGKKKCDLPNSMLYRLMRMADGFRRRPLIEKAFKAGLISKEQARQILRISDEGNERIWIDYAAHSPSVMLKEELERCLRIIDYDCFSRSFYNIVPGFRYITDERYSELPDEIKKAVRTGSWYMDSSPDEAWPLDENDEHELMERDPRLEEPWRYFEDVDDFLVYEAEVSTRKSKKSLCASPGENMGTDSFLKDKKSISEKRVSPLSWDEDGESRKRLCASLDCQDKENRKSLCASPGENMGTDSFLNDEKLNQEKRVSPLSWDEDGGSRKSLCAAHQGLDEETLSTARAICTMPHGADPAETFVLDILADQVGTLPRNSTMPIKFFLAEELFGMWNICYVVYMGTDSFLKDKKPISEKRVSPLSWDDSAQGFIAALLQEWLIIERLHFKVTRNYAILKRDRFRCQVPGCNCRRNLHIHHIIPRSHGGSDDPENLIVLCEKCHLRLLHDLHTLKIEGTAPFNLTFTFGGISLHRDGKHFLKYVRGRKVLQSGILRTGQNSRGDEKMTA